MYTVDIADCDKIERVAPHLFSFLTIGSLSFLDRVFRSIVTFGGRGPIRSVWWLPEERLPTFPGAAEIHLKFTTTGYWTHSSPQRLMLQIGRRFLCDDWCPRLLLLQSGRRATSSRTWARSKRGWIQTLSIPIRSKHKQDLNAHQREVSTSPFVESSEIVCRITSEGLMIWIGRQTCGRHSTNPHTSPNSEQEWHLRHHRHRFERRIRANEPR